MKVRNVDGEARIGAIASMVFELYIVVGWKRLVVECVFDV